METGCKIVKKEMASAKVFIEETLPTFIRAFMGAIKGAENKSIQHQMDLITQALSRKDLAQATLLYDALASQQNLASQEESK